MNETIFVASAGTGKTTTLLNKLEELLEHTAPERIVYTTFTNSGANEAIERACKRFKLRPEQFPYFRTLHSLCYRNVRRYPMMTFSDYIDFGKNIGYPINALRAVSAKDGVVNPNSTRGDKLLAMDNLMRNKLIGSFKEMCFNKSINAQETPQVLEHFSKSYRKYKESIAKIDFTDQLEMFLNQNEPLDADYMFCDEAQDFSKLQWKIIDVLAKSAEHVYVAGDDKQSIYEFSGGDPDSLIRRAGNRVILDTCYRLPKSILNFAESVASRIKNKTVYSVKSVADGGNIQHISNLNQVDMTKGSWLLLGRNRAFLPVLEDAIIQKGHLFKSIVNNIIPANLPPAIHVWQHLHRGFTASAKDIKTIYQNYLPTGKRVKRGFKKLMQALPDDEMLSLKCLIENYGLICDLPWDQAFEIQPRLKLYLQKAFEKDKSKTRIEITTIHATKGREADNVIILPDMSWTTWNSFKENPDTEHRTFYVACTRAKKNLYIHQPISDNFYQYPS